VKQHPTTTTATATATATATQASALSAGGAAVLDAPKDGELAHKGWRAINARRRAELEERNPRTRIDEERKEMQAKKAAREAEASARRAKFEEMVETLGPEAAKQALRREVKEDREAKRLARLEAHRAEKQERRAQRMIRDPARANRRGGGSVGRGLSPPLQCAFFSSSENCPRLAAPSLFLKPECPQFAAGSETQRSLGSGGHVSFHPDFAPKTRSEPVRKQVTLAAMESRPYSH
jgi:hypothetical protein